MRRVPDDPIDDLVRAAADGVDFEGLEATVEDGGTYTLTVPEASYDGLSEAEFRDAVADHDAYVSEWHFWRCMAPQAPDQWAFLRWLEDAAERAVPDRHEALADGIATTWGQLRATVRADDGGERTYDVRHVADANEAVASLEVHRDPADAADLARYDDDGEYRPLSTAPTLRTGWVFPDLDPAALIRTVHGFYPATIANWYREREGILDVTHWHEAAERQTGIYDVVDQLDGSQVTQLAATCCVDSACLKRRAWDVTEDEPIDVPRGEGEFPCREPCSLVIDAARERVLADDEQAGSDGRDGR